MFQELTEDNLEQIVSSNDMVFVQYAAGWCGNCRVMKPKFKKFSQEHEEIPFVLVDAEKLPNSRKLAKVDNLPTFAVFKKGALLNQTQTNRAENLKQFIDEATAN